VKQGKGTTVGACGCVIVSIDSVIVQMVVTSDNLEIPLQRVHISPSRSLSSSHHPSDQNYVEGCIGINVRSSLLGELPRGVYDQLDR
ncbi:hypothetical protein RJ639_018165, partial [Escallonia herrerae]